MWMEVNGAVDAPRRGPAAGNASRRDRWGKEGGLVNIYIINCYFYSRIPPLVKIATSDPVIVMFDSQRLSQ